MCNEESKSCTVEWFDRGNESLYKPSPVQKDVWRKWRSESDALNWDHAVKGEGGRGWRVPGPVSDFVFYVSCKGYCNLTIFYYCILTNIYCAWLLKRLFINCAPLQASCKYTLYPSFSIYPQTWRCKSCKSKGKSKRSKSKSEQVKVPGSKASTVQNQLQREALESDGIQTRLPSANFIYVCSIAFTVHV